MKNTYVLITAIIAIAIISGGVAAYTFSGTFDPNTNHNSTDGEAPPTSPTSHPPQNTVYLNGAGATFPYPLLNAIISEYTTKVASNILVNYQDIGSGGGISSLIAKTIDFAGSDAPLKSAEAEQAPNALHIPETIGAVTVAYRLPDVPSGLRLTGKILADIFEGKITKWNDQAIQSLNQEITLPTENIFSVHRADGSGTTFIFTGYLTASSESWNTNIGQGKNVPWPVGIGAKGNTGVASVVQGQDYTIGYIELAYALENNITVAAIQNPSGNWILPTLESTSKAAESAASGGLPNGDDDWSQVNILNAPGEEAYPIVSFSYLIVYKELNVIPGMTENKAMALVKFLSYVVHDGQQFASELEYAPLPTNVIQLNENTLNSITFNGKTIITN